MKSNTDLISVTKKLRRIRSLVLQGEHVNAFYITRLSNSPNARQITYWFTWYQTLNMNPRCLLLFLIIHYSIIHLFILFNQWEQFYHLFLSWCSTNSDILILHTLRLLNRFVCPEAPLVQHITHHSLITPESVMSSYVSQSLEWILKHFYVRTLPVLS